MKLPLETQDAFLRDYHEYVNGEIREVERAVAHQLGSVWTSLGYWAEYAGESAANPMPIQRIRIRVKEPDRVLSKYRRLREEFDGGASPSNLRKMRDLLGARVITYFQANIAMIDGEIRRGTSFGIADGYAPRSYVESDVLKRIGLNPENFDVKGRKPSGYSSIHYFLKCLDGQGDPYGPIFELQVRTMAEEVWGEIEHQLAYKPEGKTDPEVEAQFRVIGKHLGVIDEHFDSLLQLQLQRQKLASPSDEDTLDADNLPKILSELGFTSEQNQLSYILDLLVMSNIRTVRQLRQSAPLDVVSRIRDDYNAEANSEVSALSFIHIVAQFGSSPPEGELDTAIRRQVVLDRYALENAGVTDHTRVEDSDRRSLNNALTVRDRF